MAGYNSLTMEVKAKVKAEFNDGRDPVVKEQTIYRVEFLGSDGTKNKPRDTKNPVTGQIFALPNIYMVCNYIHLGMLNHLKGAGESIYILNRGDAYHIYASEDGFYLPSAIHTNSDEIHLPFTSDDEEDERFDTLVRALRHSKESIIDSLVLNIYLLGKADLEKQDIKVLQDPNAKSFCIDGVDVGGSSGKELGIKSFYVSIEDIIFEYKRNLGKE